MSWGRWEAAYQTQYPGIYNRRGFTGLEILGHIQAPGCNLDLKLLHNRCAYRSQRRRALTAEVRNVRGGANRQKSNLNIKICGVLIKDHNMDQRKREYSLKMRMALSGDEVIKQGGEINHEYFLHKKGAYFGKKEENELITVYKQVQKSVSLTGEEAIKLPWKLKESSTLLQKFVNLISLIQTV